MELVSCTQEDEDGHQTPSSRQATLSCGSVCATTRVGSNFNTWLQTRLTRASSCVVNLIACVLSAALSLLFAVVGACTGAMIGALAGWASNGGIFRGAGLCAVAGAIISTEVLEAFHAYWCWDHSASHSLSSMADFIQELVRDRFVDELFQPAALRASQSQDFRGGAASRGLSGDSLKKLPCHVKLDENKGAENICCTICLQDIGIWEIARRLPQCHHTFHLTCVDKWLIRHDSCPVCRQVV